MYFILQRKKNYDLYRQTKIQDFYLKKKVSFLNFKKLINTNDLKNLQIFADEQKQFPPQDVRFDLITPSQESQNTKNPREHQRVRVYTRVYIDSKRRQ